MYIKRWIVSIWKPSLTLFFGLELYAVLADRAIISSMLPKTTLLSFVVQTTLTLVCSHEPQPSVVSLGTRLAGRNTNGVVSETLDNEVCTLLSTTSRQSRPCASSPL